MDPMDIVATATDWNKSLGEIAGEVAVNMVDAWYRGAQRWMQLVDAEAKAGNIEIETVMSILHGEKPLTLVDRVPRLSMLLQAFGMLEVNYETELNVDASSVDTKSKDFHADVKENLSIGFGWLKSTTQITGGFACKSENTRKTDFRGRSKLTMRMGALPMPEGLALINKNQAAVIEGGSKINLELAKAYAHNLLQSGATPSGETKDGGTSDGG